MSDKNAGPLARAWRKACKRAAICYQCKCDVTPGRTLCERHQALATARTLRCVARKLARGKCRHCKQPRVDGLKVCADHRLYEKNRHRTRRVYEREALVFGLRPFIERPSTPKTDLA